MILKSKNKNSINIKNKKVGITIVIKHVDINKIVVSNKVPLGKKDLNILLVTKMLKKINLYVYFSQKCLHIEKTLIKLSIPLF